jgi:hypothetical protein
LLKGPPGGPPKAWDCEGVERRRIETMERAKREPEEFDFFISIELVLLSRGKVVKDFPVCFFYKTRW